MIAYAAAAAVLTCLAAGAAYAETNFEEVRFIQYLDENTALEEVRKGNIDMYFWQIPSERLATAEDREGINIYESSGNTYSILLNPAEADPFNPFSLRDVRFAVNYLLDRNLVVNELMAGYGVPMTAYYGPLDPEYISLIEDLESYNFQYNPVLANQMISDAMEGAGAVMQEGVWTMDGSPVEITFVIRSDDPTRKSIGELLSLELENAGFAVNQDFGDLNKAFVVVYGSDPAEQQWHLYTEGWGSTGFVRYDSVGLAQMYSPWFATMPGFNNPAFWNYENPDIDALTQAIYSGNFTSAEGRTDLIREALAIGVDESVRIFLAGRIQQYVANDNIEGVVNDFGAGLPSRFTVINARAAGDTTLDVGVKQVYQGAWNPVGGLSDLYSNHVWRALYDPPVFLNPYSGSALPVIATWDTETAGPGAAMDIPPDAVLWDVETQSWQEVGDDASATSVVTFQYDLGDWHHGIPYTMADIMYGVYFSTEWGTQSGEGDRTFDPEFSPRAAPLIETLKGFRITGPETLEVYVDYWHFDDGEIVLWASTGASMPWEVQYAMEQAVLDGKTAFSRSVATTKEVSWLSVLLPDDTAMLREYLAGFAESGQVPAALSEMADDAAERYEAAISWIDQYEHAVISNGPYMMKGYSPESRIITIQEYADESYPFAADKWSEFESVSVPKIDSIDVPPTVTHGEDLAVSVSVWDADSIKYFVSDADGVALAGEVRAEAGDTRITFDTSPLAGGAVTVKIFALSETVLRPASHSADFFVLGATDPQPTAIPDWVRTNAGWWAEGLISDADFVTGMLYLAQEGILVIDAVTEPGQDDAPIPDWVRTNAGWWAEGLISDEEFARGMEYLVQSGIIPLG